MSWRTIADNDQETVCEKVRADGSTEYVHIYKDPSLRRKAKDARNGKHGDHDYIVFDKDGNTVYDSTRLQPPYK